MELRHLSYFVAVAEELHFGNAAKRLNMSQPPLSQRIQDLERELGVVLLERSSRRVELTEAGALLLEHARTVLSEVDNTRQAIDRIRAHHLRRLRVGIPPDTLPDVLPSVVRAYRSRDPHGSLDVRELTTNEQVSQLRAGELDVGVLRHPCDTVGLEIGPLLRRPIGILLPTDHPAAGQPIVRLRDLNGSPLIIFPRGMASELYDFILSTCRDQGYRPAGFRHARNPHFIHGLVLAGFGIHLNERPLGPMPPGIVWRELAGEPLAWLTSTAWRVPSGQRGIRAFTDAVAAALVAAGHQPLPGR